MNILACVVTYNRVEYTRKCIASLLEDDTNIGIVVVDNGSTDETRSLLDDLETWRHAIVIRNTRNLFPGAATNIGWHAGLKRFNADLLMRSDNDFEYLPGWADEVRDAFRAHPALALLGLHNRHEDYDGNPPVKPHEGLDGHIVNVEWDQWGGNVVIPRRLYDNGLRWTPGAWAPGGTDEDSKFAAEARKHGLVAGLGPTVCRNMSFHQYDKYPDYYNQTAALRGLVPELSV